VPQGRPAREVRTRRTLPLLPFFGTLTGGAYGPPTPWSTPRRQKLGLPNGPCLRPSRGARGRHSTDNLLMTPVPISDRNWRHHS
jgi:hypothetical protein